MPQLAVPPQVPDDAYQEALHRIEQARKTDAIDLDLTQLGLAEVPPEIGKLQRL